MEVMSRTGASAAVIASRTMPWGGASEEWKRGDGGAGDCPSNTRAHDLQLVCMPERGHAATVARPWL